MRRLSIFLTLAMACVMPCHAGSESDMELARVITIDQIDKMAGLVFETYVCHLLTSQGYGVKNIRGTNDFGVDAVATKDGKRTAIQIKRSDNPIDRSAVSDATAGKKYYKCSQAMVITNSTPTKSAREFAREVNCPIIEREELLRWIAKFRQQSKGD
jgi:restriction system protein